MTSVYIPFVRNIEIQLVLPFPRTLDSHPTDTLKFKKPLTAWDVSGGLGS